MTAQLRETGMARATIGSGAGMIHGGLVALALALPAVRVASAAELDMDRAALRTDAPATASADVDPSRRIALSDAQAVADLLAGLLRHPDEAVRRDAATALGKMGPAARSALVALQEAYDREFELLPVGTLIGPGSTMAVIGSAMLRIRSGTAPPDSGPVCADPEAR
ncbi:HEAT repeat domain-containing protein [Arenimonas composti]|uniref:HEAT repeat domain-containing protein n=1 Tax=Arenimonas composti TR7-09 = DSM 18010 TaxID=1121013 RepID=A0A091BHV7_9GAMM|nr:HEAT repeat domain-containing protein [Arenimonas composti]KFN51336.1 hypothetical protein P873_03450 [Arenimonas composti TR7-09 = DSM 18010]